MKKNSPNIPWMQKMNLSCSKPTKLCWWLGSLTTPGLVWPTNVSTIHLEDGNGRSSPNASPFWSEKLNLQFELVTSSVCIQLCHFLPIKTWWLTCPGFQVLHLEKGVSAALTWQKPAEGEIKSCTETLSGGGLLTDGSEKTISFFPSCRPSTDV